LIEKILSSIDWGCGGEGCGDGGALEQAATSVTTPKLKTRNELHPKSAEKR
jgi:hypothetical protein